MAEEKIFHFTINNFNRAKGHSASQKGAYRTGSLIVDPRTGKTYNYISKKVKEKIENVFILNEGADEKFKDPAVFFSEIDKTETRSNSRLFSEAEFSLFRDLTPEQNKELAIIFAKKFHEKYKTPLVVSTHRLESDNPHCHMSFCERKIEGDRFSKKKIRGELKHRSFIKEARKLWADTANSYFKEKGLDWFIDHRSYDERGIEKIPMPRINPHSDFQKAIEPGVQDLKKRIKKYNQRKDLKRYVKLLSRRKYYNFKYETELGLDSTLFSARGVFSMLNLTKQQEQKAIDLAIRLGVLKGETRRILFKEKAELNTKERLMREAILEELQEFLGDNNVDHLTVKMLDNAQIRVDVVDAKMSELHPDSIERKVFHKFFGDLDYYDDLDVVINREYHSDSGIETSFEYTFPEGINQDDLKDKIKEFELELEVNYLKMEERLYNRELENLLFEVDNIEVSETEIIERLKDNQKFKELEKIGYEVLSAADFEKEFGKDPAFSLSGSIPFSEKLEKKAKETLTARQYRAVALLNATYDKNKFWSMKRQFEKQHNMKFNNYLTNETKERFGVRDNEQKIFELIKVDEKMQELNIKRKALNDIANERILEDLTRLAKKQNKELIVRSDQLTEIKERIVKDGKLKFRPSRNTIKAVKALNNTEKELENLEKRRNRLIQETEITQEELEWEKRNQNKYNTIDSRAKEYEEKVVNLRQEIQKQRENFQNKLYTNSKRLTELNKHLSTAKQSSEFVREQIRNMNWMEKYILNRAKYKELLADLKQHETEERVYRHEILRQQNLRTQLRLEQRETIAMLKDELKNGEEIEVEKLYRNLKEKENKTINDSFEAKIEAAKVKYKSLKQQEQLQEEIVDILKEARIENKKQLKAFRGYLNERIEDINIDIDLVDVSILRAEASKAKNKAEKEEYEKTIKMLEKEKRSLIEQRNELIGLGKEKKQQYKEIKKMHKLEKAVLRNDKVKSRERLQEVLSLKHEKEHVYNKDQELSKDNVINLNEKNYEIQIEHLGEIIEFPRDEEIQKILEKEREYARQIG